MTNIENEHLVTSEQKQLTTKVIKSKKAVSYKDFMATIYPISKMIQDDKLILIRPDMSGCKVEGLAPYGSYAKIIIDKSKDAMYIWNIDPTRPEADKMIVNGIEIPKDLI